MKSSETFSISLNFSPTKTHSLSFTSEQQIKKEKEKKPYRMRCAIDKQATKTPAFFPKNLSTSTEDCDKEFGEVYFYLLHSFGS